MPQRRRRTDPVPSGHAALLAAVFGRVSAAEYRRRQQRELHRSLNALGSVVYFIRFGTYVKIGYTAHLQARLKSLGRSVSDVLAVMPGGFAEEQELHQRFTKARVINELFDPTPEVLALINELRAKAGVPLIA